MLTPTSGSVVSDSPRPPGRYTNAPCAAGSPASAARVTQGYGATRLCASCRIRLLVWPEASRLATGVETV